MRWGVPCSTMGVGAVHTPGLPLARAYAYRAYERYACLDVSGSRCASGRATMLTTGRRFMATRDPPSLDAGQAREFV